MAQQNDYQRKYDSLSPREKEILTMFVWENQSDSQIAEKLKIQESTVRKNRQNIAEKLGIETKATDELHRDRTKNSQDLINFCKRYGMGSPNFYIERSLQQKKCDQTIERKDGFLRIKSPEKFGKTTLLSQVIDYARNKNYQTINIDFASTFDSESFTNYELFIKQFCLSITDSLDLDEDELTNSWKLGSSNRKCTNYLKKYILPKIENSLVIALDNVDLIFESEICRNDFCQLLRGWNDKSKEINADIWRKLRLIIVHSTDNYSKWDINSSPLKNIGETIDLSEFNQDEILQLIQRYGLNFNQEQIKNLSKIIGGHPYLLNQLFKTIKDYNYSLEEILEKAGTEEGIFADYLRKILHNLQQSPDLLESFLTCINSEQGIELDSKIAFKLNRMGLVNFDKNKVIPRCDLYIQYFKKFS